MPDFAAQWSAAKNKALKNPLPPELVLSLSQGWDLGPALKRFDKADTHEKRAKAILAVLKATTAYQDDLKAALKQSRSPAEKKNVETLDGALAEIWRDVEQAAQPPRPSGAAVSHEVLRAFNLAAGLELKYLDVKATEVTVVIEIDKVLDQLIKDGKESLKIQHLGEVAKAELEKVRPLFTKTIKDIEAKIARDLSLRESKAKEANEVLKHYARIVEDRVNQEVGAQWDKYLERAQHLKDFKFKSGVKITLGVIGVSVAAASLALSFGTAWMSIFAIAKGVAELIQNVATLTQSIDKTAKSLEDSLKDVDKLNKQREEAKAKHEGQKGSKSKEAAKELLNALLPVTKLMTKSASTVEADAKQLLGQVANLEQAADNAVGALNKALKALSGLPAKEMTPAQLAEAKKMDLAINDFFAKINSLHKEAQRYGDFGDRALAATKKLKSADSWSAGLTANVSGLGTKGTALYAAANFVYQCANAGKSLIPL